MTRLIDADVMKESIIAPRSNGKDLISEWIDAQPTVDAVPVIRCEDCKWGREISGNVECNVDINNPPEYHGYKWFCPLGERNEG